MRLRYIDYTKGLAIILMLFGHTMTKINFVHIWIYSFHMPVFFVIGGILMYRKETRREFGDFVRSNIIRRLRTTAVPYYVFGSMLAVFYTLLNIIGDEPISFFEKMFNLLALKGIDSLWFLPTYILAEIIMELIGNQRTYGKKLHFTMILCSFLIVTFLSDYMSIWYLDILYKVLLGICFIGIGLLCSRFAIVEKTPICVDCVLLIIGLLLAQKNGSVEMAAGNIGNSVIYYLCATPTTIAIMILMKKVEYKKIKLYKVLEVYGKNSIVIVCTNNLLIEIIRLFDYKVTGNFLASTGMVGCVIFTIILMVIEWYCIKLANGTFAPIFGRIKQGVQ